MGLPLESSLETAQPVEKLLLMPLTPRNQETATSKTTPLDALPPVVKPKELLPMDLVLTIASLLLKTAQLVERLLLMLPTPRNPETATSRTTPLDALPPEVKLKEPPLTDLVLTTASL